MTLVLKSMTRMAMCLALLTGGMARSVLAEPAASTFRLSNGLEVVVIPDHRLPVVTHMVWYRVGAADDPRGRTGLAHLVEHLMFKATGRIQSGEFARIIARLGGNDNARAENAVRPEKPGRLSKPNRRAQARPTRRARGLLRR